MGSILFVIETKVEMVKFDKTPVHAFFTIFGQNLTYNKIDII